MGRKRWIGWALGLLGLLLVSSLYLFGGSKARESARQPESAPAATIAGMSRREPAMPLPTPTPSLIERLRDNPMPPYDHVTLPSEVRGIPIPRTVLTTPTEAQIGDVQRFWVGDMAADAPPRYYQITATLRVQSEHLQMWVQEGIEAAPDALERSAAAFEKHIYPAIRSTFGPEWTPGVDGDPHLLVLNAHFEGAVGYFSSINEYSHLANPYSNEHEMFAMNLEVIRPGTPQYDAVLAHEFQHMVHWYADSHEDAWVSEGCSELAEDLVGSDGPYGSVRAFEDRPATQLNTWSDDSGVGAHYGASYLFMRYFLDRYGAEMLHELVQEPASGIAGFNALLARREITTTYDELFADWLVANLLDDPQIGDFRRGIAPAKVHVKSHKIETDTPAVYTDTVPQYAAQYVELTPVQEGSLRLSFTGTPTVPLVPNSPTSGSWEWWSGRGDASHSMLERDFDLRHVSTATLFFNLWYDIEEGWDYAYVRASTDGGAHWQLLRGAHMVDYNPNGNALGAGYTGKSGQPEEEAPQWIHETVDLGAYGGQRVRICFDYVTDDAVNKPGLCLDDLQVAAIGFTDDVEASSSEEPSQGGWRAQGFMRHDNQLPQRYLVQAVTFSPEPHVERLEVDADGRGEWTLAGCQNTECRAPIVIVSAIAPATTEPAHFRLQVAP